MKRKISKILGVSLTVVLLASLLVMAAPASASTLAWGEETTTKNLKSTTLSTSLAPANTDIVDLAVNGSTIYAATGTGAADNITYKSTDGGVTWSSLYFTTSYPKKAVKKVAVAPDDANTVVLLTADNYVYYSSAGGSSWSNLSVPATGATISDIDISGGTTKTIAAAGKTSGGVAELYTLSVALAQSWTARYDTTGTAPAGGASVNQTNIFTAKFSPNYTNDNIIVVVSGNSTEIPLVQTFRNTTGARGWNTNITGFTNWATGINILSAPTGGIGTADIALLPTYRGTDETERIAFVAIGGVTSGGGVVRLSDVTATELKTWSGVNLGAIGSLAYSSAGLLLAGDYDTNQVYRFLTPLASAPKAEAITSFKQPGGQTKTVVAWVGDNAVATTTGDESAFALSTDSGKTYNDISLIDTAITTMSDVALNAAGSKLYLTTNDGTDTSVWVKLTAGWQRILSRRADTTKHLVRIAPEDDAVAYVADQGTTDMWVTKNSGTTWSYIPIYNLSLIQDFVVESANVVYAIDTAGLSKTSDAGGSWGSKKTPTDTFTAYMVTLATNSAGTNDVLIGGSGYVAYSKDAGATLTRTQATTVTGDVQVVADVDYATNNFIYAGVATVVNRGKADATTTFLARTPTIDTTHTVKGLVRDGTMFYALSSNSSDSALHRALNLTSTVASSTDALWSSVTSTYEFISTPQALRLTTGGVLWAIDDANTLTSFTDALTVGAPALTAPATPYEIPVNVTTGLAYDTTFSWTRQNTSVTGTVLEIASDAAFSSIIYTKDITGITTDTISRVIGPSGSTDDTGARANFMPGTTYYWRVRASAPLRSVWSETRTLTVAQVTPATTTITVTAPAVTVEAPAVTPPTISLTVPAAGAHPSVTNVSFTWTSITGATSYNLVISANADLSSPITVTTVGTAYTYTGTLGYSTPYYWQVTALQDTTELAKSNMATFVTVAAPAVVTPTLPVVAAIRFAIVSPAVGATDVSLNPILTWTPYEKAIGYEVALATDPTFKIIDYSHNVPVANTFYASEPLAYGTTYYWRVRGVTGPAPEKKAAPGGDWATGAFTTIAKPVEAAKVEPTVIVQKEQLPAPPAQVIEVPVQTVVPQPIPSYLLWIIIVIGAVLLIALIVLIARTRRVA